MSSKYERYAGDREPKVGYETKPTALRIFFEDQGDGFPWHLDGINFDRATYTADVGRYANVADLLASIPTWVQRYSLEPEREWHPMTLGQIRGWLAMTLGVGDWSTTEPPFEITEVRETEHGVEYR